MPDQEVVGDEKGIRLDLDELRILRADPNRLRCCQVWEHLDMSPDFMIIMDRSEGYEKNMGILRLLPPAITIHPKLGAICEFCLVLEAQRRWAMSHDEIQAEDHPVSAEDDRGEPVGWLKVADGYSLSELSMKVEIQIDKE